jgi:uncharacterized protein (TIGR03437 family)
VKTTGPSELTQSEVFLVKNYTNLVLVLMAATAAHAATSSITLAVNTSVSVGTTAITASGTATVTNPTATNGTFSANIPLSGVSGSTISGTYTVTVSGGSFSGTLTLPFALLTGTSNTATGSATITSGTGSYAGATGSFPSLSGSGSIGANGIAVTFTGTGTVTTSGSSGPPTPTISQVVDAAAYGSGIAQGSIFIVKGSNLSASGFTSFGFPLPTTSGSNGSSITFTPTAGGTGTAAYLIYVYNQNGVNQIAAILPSTLAVGNYNVTVSYNGTTSAPFAASVVARRFTLFTQDSTGGGLIVVQNFISATRLDVDRLTTGSVSGVTISPASPGQTLIAWGTGLGPVTGGDNVASPGFNFAANGVNVQVIVGGTSITPLYAGRAPGLAGEDQINFTLPSNIATGCTVSFQISVNGTVSNAGYISIAPNATAGACVQPGFTTSQLQNLDQGSTFDTGSFVLNQFSESVPSIGSVKLDQVSGSFTQYSAFELGSTPPLQAQIQAPTPGCQLIPLVGATTSSLFAGSGLALDAGVVTINGPSGSNISNLNLTETANTYALLLGEEGLGTSIPGVPNGVLVAGTYTLSGAGGKDVGKFNASLALGAPLTVTGGLPASVTRSAGLTVNWTGGSSTDIVTLFGLAGTASGSGANVTTTGEGFICTTTAGAGSINVPSSILNQLPAVSAASITAGTNSGFLALLSTAVPTSTSGQFTAPLTAGGTINATFLSLLGAASLTAYQ